MKNKNVSGKNQSPEKSPYVLLKEKLAELRKNAGLLAAKKDEVHETALEANRKSTAAGEARGEASRFLNEIRGQNASLRGKPDLDQSQQIKLDRRETAAAEAETAAKEANNKVNRLNDEISELQCGLAGMMLDFQAEDVLSYQEETAKAEKVVASLEDSIRQQEVVIENAQGMIPASEDFNGQREDLLAEIATGAASEKELEELDRRAAASIDAAKKANAEAQEIIAPARQTINGLRRKLAAAQDVLSTLKEIGPEVMNQFFRSEAERIGSEYASLAGQLIDRYEKLLACDKMLGNPSQLTNRGIYEIKIPLFRVKACEGHEYSRGIMELSAAVFAVDSKRQGEVYRAEISRLRDMGIVV